MGIMGFVLRTGARPGAPIDPNRVNAPLAPAAVHSPQEPGETPWRSTVPGHGQLPVPPATSVRRPETEYGTAQRIMGIHAVRGDNKDDPQRFELGPQSYEELRKAFPALRQPLSATPNYALTDGERIQGAAPGAIEAPVRAAVSAEATGGM
jgi:hypothetical protein